MFQAKGQRAACRISGGKASYVDLIQKGGGKTFVEMK